MITFKKWGNFSNLLAPKRFYGFSDNDLGAHLLNQHICLGQWGTLKSLDTAHGTEVGAYFDILLHPKTGISKSMPSPNSKCQKLKG